MTKRINLYSYKVLYKRTMERDGIKFFDENIVRRGNITDKKSLFLKERTFQCPHF